MANIPCITKCLISKHGGDSFWFGVLVALFFAAIVGFIACVVAGGVVTAGIGLGVFTLTCAATASGVFWAITGGIGLIAFLVSLLSHIPECASACAAADLGSSGSKLTPAEPPAGMTCAEALRGMEDAEAKHADAKRRRDAQAGAVNEWDRRISNARLAANAAASALLALSFWNIWGILAAAATLAAMRLRARMLEAQSQEARVKLVQLEIEVLALHDSVATWKRWVDRLCSTRDETGGDIPGSFPPPGKGPGTSTTRR